MQRLFFIFLVLCFSLFVKGQAPGYMGKKTTIGYGFNINPAIAAALSDYGTSVVNTQHEFFIEHVIKKRVSLGLSFKVYRSTYNNTGKADMTRVYNALGYTNYSSVQFSTFGELGYFYSPRGKITIHASNYMAYAKIYRKKYVAPWGKYMQLGLTLNMRTCTYDPDEMMVSEIVQRQSYPYTSYVMNYNDFGPTTQNYIYPDLLFGMGNCRIFGKHLLLDYGWNINAAAFLVGVVDAFDGYKPEPEKYIQTNSGMRVRGINRFNAFIKVAYLF